MHSKRRGFQASQYYAGAAPPARRTTGAPAAIGPSGVGPQKSGKICGLSGAKLCIYGLLLIAYSLLMMVLGVTFGRSFSGLASLATMAASKGGPASVGGQTNVKMDAGAWKPPVETVAKDAAAEEAQKAAQAAPQRQQDPGYPGAADVPAGWVYAKDKTSKDQGWPKLEFATPSDADLEGTAFVTMATGDESARHAVALIQSLRDSNTRIPNVVVLLFRGGSGSADCNNPFMRKARGRDHIICEGPETTANEIVSQKYLDAFTRMGAVYRIEDPLPETPFTKDIPGGRQIAWGMALNKLKVLGLTDYKRVIWCDSDVMIINNIDHLILEPDFTAAFTNDCCNRNADCKMSGGFWIFTPSKAYIDEVIRLISSPIPGSNGEAWLFGDMQVALHMFGKVTEKSPWREWPFSRDMRQGTVPGIRVLPAYQNLSDHVMEVELTQNGRRNRGMPPEGLLPDELAEAQRDGKTVWHMLDPRYDGLVGNCECVPERDLGSQYFTVHYTCLPVTPPVHKPGRYENEDEFLTHVRTRMFACMRYFYLRWYDAYARGMGSRLPEPFYEGPEIRVVDADADREVARNRQQAFEDAINEEKRRREGGQ